MVDVDWNFILSITTTFATAVLVLVIILQTKVFRTQTGLGYLPFIAPRHIPIDADKASIFFDNVGVGNAVDVCIRIYDMDGNKLQEISRYVSKPGELATTGVTLRRGSKFRIVGSYRDTNRKIHKIDRTYRYPPECLSTDLEEYEEEYLARLERKKQEEQEKSK